MVALHLQSRLVQAASQPIRKFLDYGELVEHHLGANRQRAAQSGASLVGHCIAPRNVGPNRHSLRVGGGSVPPQPSGGIAQECSTAPVVVPHGTRFCRQFAGFSVVPPASACRRHQPGERESMGAEVPRAELASASELSDARRSEPDKNYAMRRRSKQRDALSVRNLGRSECEA